MSVEQAKAFIERMKTDEAFRDMIMAIEMPEDRLKAIEEAGYDCSREEINGVADAHGMGAEPVGGIICKWQYNPVTHSCYRLS